MQPFHLLQYKIKMKFPERHSNETKFQERPSVLFAK